MENETEAQYQFYDTAYEENKGILSINKKTGEYSIVTPIKSKNISSRACIKIYRHWLKGEFPEKTMWAS